MGLCAVVNTNRMSNILNSDQDRHFISLDSGQDQQNVSPGLDLNCLQFWLITYFIEPLHLNI